MSTAAAYLADETGERTGLHIQANELCPEAASRPAREAAVHSEVECLCPFCGSFNFGVGKACSNCKLTDTSETRAANKQRLGPWFVLQSDNPAAPGMNLEELQSLVARQIVTSRSVVRGPTTAHLWRLASKVRGLSREFGLCYSCGGNIETTEIICPHCDRAQSVPEQSQPPAPAPIVPPLKVEIPQPPVATEPKPPAPAIHVHTLSNPTGKEELEFLPRPVIAEKSERHIPKDDLLTPRDVAKAFQLEFGLQTERLDLYFDKPRISRRLRIFVSSAAALVIAVALVFPLVRSVSERINASPSYTGSRETPVQYASAASSTTAGADARTASAQIAVLRPDPTAAKSEAHPAPLADPIIVADPNQTASPEDDPAMLWNAGINAESNGNYTKAVEAYERIESLPSYAWPAHLQVRLELARKELKGQLR